jgi:hypothetical protein
LGVIFFAKKAAAHVLLCAATSKASWNKGKIAFVASSLLNY